MLKGTRSLIPRSTTSATPTGLAQRVAQLETTVAQLRAQINALRPASPLPAARASAPPTSPVLPPTPVQATSPPPPSPPAPATPAPLAISPAPLSPALAAVTVRDHEVTTKDCLGQFVLPDLKVNELHMLCSFFNLTPPKKCKKQQLVTMLAAL